MTENVRGCKYYERHSVVTRSVCYRKEKCVNFKDSSWLRKTSIQKFEYARLKFEFFQMFNRGIKDRSLGDLLRDNGTPTAIGMSLTGLTNVLHYTLSDFERLIQLVATIFSGL